MHKFLPLYFLNKNAYILYCHENDYVQVSFNKITLILPKEDFIDFVQDPFSAPLFRPIQHREQLLQLLEGADTALLDMEMEHYYKTEF